MTDFAPLLHAKAIDLGRLAIGASTAAGSGHPTTALSLAHLVAVLMYRVMRWTPADPSNPGSDRLVLSEGHAVPIIYAACADLGVAFQPDGKRRTITERDLMALREIGSAIDGHPNPVLGFPFFDAAAGSLSQGLSVAAGLGCAAWLDSVPKYALPLDAEPILEIGRRAGAAVLAVEDSYAGGLGSELAEASALLAAPVAVESPGVRRLSDVLNYVGLSVPEIAAAAERLACRLRSPHESV